VKHETLIRGLPLDLERKDDPDPIEEIKTLFGQHHDEVKKLAAEVKKFDGWATDLEKKINRARLTGGGGGGASDTENAADLEAERKAIGAFVKSGSEVGFKDYTVGNDPAAGYLVMPERSRIIMKRLYDDVPMRRLARVITLTSGDSWEEPVDPNEVGAEWVGETESRSETASGDVGVHNYPLCEIFALQKVSQKLLDTSDYDIAAWIDDRIGGKFARSEDLAFVSGDGIRKPRGFLTRDTSALGDATRPWGTLQHVISGAATSVMADSLRDVYWSLKAAHRTNATWLMSSATANSIDKLKDGNGDYLWRNGMTAGAPPSLLGREVAFDENMPEVDAGTFPIAFGDFKAGYTIVDKAGLRPLRDPYSAKPWLLFYTYKRTGGDMSNSDAIKLLKIAAS
jgi:HK97 family phage major capsid protein